MNDWADYLGLFFSQSYEKDIDKLVRDDRSFVIPYEQLRNYVNLIIDIPYKEYISYLLSHPLKKNIETKDITQSSSFSACEIEMCNAIFSIDNPGLSYIDIGKLFPQYVSHPNDGALRKYGENQIKTSAHLGLVYEYYKYWYLSCLGYLYPQLEQETRMKLLARTILRTPFYYRMMVDLYYNNTEATKYMHSLSKATQIRREGSVCRLLEICLDECHREGIKMHRIIKSQTMQSNHKHEDFDLFSLPLEVAAERSEEYIEERKDQFLTFSEPKSSFTSIDDLYNIYAQKINSIRQAVVRGEVIVAKPVLLLSLIDGISEGVFVNNKFVLNDWLEKRYEQLMQMYSGQSGYKAFTPVNYPVWHLERDGFWHLHIEGDRQKITSTPTTNALKRLVHYASFDDDLWTLLQDQGKRDRLRSFIISNKLQRH